MRRALLVFSTQKTGDEQDAKTLAQAERIYQLFVSADTDGSGCISIEEYVCFCSNEGVSRTSAEAMFYKADIDGNGNRKDDALLLLFVVLFDNKLRVDSFSSILCSK